VFAPLASGGRVDAVVERLSQAIRLGLIRDGEQLPNEQDLATHFGVSTVTLREALSSLRQQGLVETRRGRGGGSFVRASSDISVARVRSRLRQMTTHELRDIGDLHRAIFGSAAQLAAERTSNELLNRLTKHVDRLRGAKTMAARRKADGRFHIEVAAASQSVRLTAAEMQIQTEIGDLMWLPFPDQPADHDSYHEQVIDQHAQLAAAIDMGHADDGRRLAEQHVEEGIERLIELHLMLVSV
jgi:GntR family transcriptional regulator, transcriptional repressor for pyruvate dehydrogenase complex